MNIESGYLFDVTNGVIYRLSALEPNATIQTK